MQTVSVISVWLMALAFLLTGSPGTTHAADNAAPVHNVDGSFVREWLVLGPFPSREMETDFLATVGGEARVRPKEGDSVTLSDGTRLTWTRLRSKSDTVNLEEVLGIRNWSVAYAYCELKCDRPLETNLRFSSSVSGSLRLNGKVIGQSSAIPGTGLDLSSALPIQLDPQPNACLLKLHNKEWEWSFSFQPLPAGRAICELHVEDQEGKPVAGALVQFYDQGELVARVRSNESGQAEACFFPSAEVYDLRITSGEIGTWLFDVMLPPGERRRIDVRLTHAVSITGRTLALDRSPQNAMVVQAIHVPISSNLGRADLPAQPKPGEGGPVRPYIGAERQLSPTRPEPTPAPLPGGELAIGPQNEAPLLGGAGGGSSAPFNPQIKSLLPLPAFSETVLSDTNGNFRFVNLRPGQYQLRGHGPDGFVAPAAGPGTNATGSGIITIGPGQPRHVIEFLLPEIKKGVWKNYSITLGLREAHPHSIHRTPDGLLWIGTDASVLQTYDGVEFKTVASAPEIPSNDFQVLQHAADGALWVGTTGGMARYAEGRMQKISFGEALARKPVNDILADADGTIWFASNSGLLRFDGQKWAAFTIQEGLPGNRLLSLTRARDGLLWVVTPQGLARFDGQNFALPQPRPDVFHYASWGLQEARDGAIWFSTHYYGAYRYDGQSFSRLGGEDGLLSDTIFGRTRRRRSGLAAAVGSIV